MPHRHMTRRHCLRSALLAAIATASCLASSASAQQSLSPQTVLTDTDLEQLIASLGLQAEKTESRFDFEFLAQMDEEQWKLSMSSVLSQDGQTLWLMAWLDELPKSAADVPRTALLRLLAENDKMGNGKFFAYIAGSRRFVLQRIVSTDGLTADSFRAALQDLGSTVVQTYPQWAVANWKPAAPAREAVAQRQAEREARPETPADQPIRTATQSAVNESKFELPVRK